MRNAFVAMMFVAVTFVAALASGQSQSQGQTSTQTQTSTQAQTATLTGNQTTKVSGGRGSGGGCPLSVFLDLTPTFNEVVGERLADVANVFGITHRERFRRAQEGRTIDLLDEVIIGKKIENYLMANQAAVAMAAEAPEPSVPRAPQRSALRRSARPKATRANSEVADYVIKIVVQVEQ